MSSDPETSGYNPFADRVEASDEQTGQEHAQAAPLQVFGKGAAAPFAAPTDAAAEVQSIPAAITAPQSVETAALDGLTMSELITRFTRSMEASTNTGHAALHADTAASPAATPAATQDAAASMPFAFQRGGSEAPEPVAEPVAAEANSSEAAFTLPSFSNLNETPENVDQPAVPASFSSPVSVEAMGEPIGQTAPNPFGVQPAETAEVPAALQPLDLGSFEDEDEDEDSDDPFESGLSLGLGGGNQDRMFNRPDDAAMSPFAAPADTAQGAMAPSPFTQPATGDESSDESSEADDEAYSSLLSMKSPLGAHHEFVRVEDEEEDADGREQVVTFPGQEQANQQTGSAVDTPEAAASRPSGATRLFDAPEGAQASSGGLARAVPTTPAVSQADPAETEKALREALEKLQRMSGAA